MTKQLSYKSLNEFNKVTISASGPRYTPNTDPNFPNIEIKELLDDFQYLSLEPPYISHLQNSLSAITESINDLARLSKTKFGNWKKDSEELLLSVNALKHCNVAEISRITNCLLSQLRKLENKVNKKLLSETDKNIRLQMERIIRSTSKLLWNFEQGPGRAVKESVVTLLEGPAGSGKTHFLCDFAIRLMKRNQPVLILTASQLNDPQGPNASIMRLLGIGNVSANPLEAMNSFGVLHNKKFIFIIDSINEADLDIWLEWVEATSLSIENLTNLCVIVSCRDIAGGVKFPSGGERVLRLSHPGFEDNALEATESFYKYYGIDPRNLPLVGEEFTNPLLLKLVCEFAHNFSKKKQRKKFEEIASGQKGLNHLLEQIVKNLWSQNRNRTQISGSECWIFFKGSSNGKKEIGFSTAMAIKKKIWLSYSEIEEIAKTMPFLTGKNLKLFIEDLLRIGIMIVTPHYDFKQKSYFNTYSFAYQAFGEHLIARYLLANHFDNSSVTSVMQSLEKGTPLGDLFLVESNFNGYQNSNLAVAVMTEFPERLKRNFDSRELISYLPEESLKSQNLVEIFISSLIWRPVADSHLGIDTKHFLNQLIKHENFRVSHSAIEATLLMAVRSKNKTFGLELIMDICALTMPERDLFWSEYLRLAYAGSPIHRLLKWIEKSQNANLVGIESIHLKLLILSLTSTDNDFRDQVTFALYKVGQSDPKRLLDLFNFTLDIGDFYILDRYLASVFGIFTRFKFDSLAKDEQEAIRVFIERAISWIALESNSRYLSHVLIQDSFAGILEFAAKNAVLPADSAKFIAAMNRIDGDFKFGARRSNLAIKNILEGFNGDFFNYTVGRTIQGRSNYDFNNTAYKAVLEKMAKVMFDLGYNRSKFESIDRRISESRFSYQMNSRLERYEKKYSWIAYYMMMGSRRIDRTRRFDSEKGRDYEISIDPTFPKPIDEASIKISNLGTQNRTLNELWLVSGSKPKLEPLLKSLNVENSGDKFIVNLDLTIASKNLNQTHMSVRCYLFSPDEMTDTEALKSVQRISKHWTDTTAQLPYNVYFGEIPNSTNLDKFESRVIEFPAESTTHISHVAAYWSLDGVDSTSVTLRSLYVLSPSISRGLELSQSHDRNGLFDNDGKLISSQVSLNTFAKESAGEALWLLEKVLADWLTSHNLKLVISLQGRREFNISYLDFNRKNPLIELMQSSEKSDFGEAIVYYPANGKLVRDKNSFLW